MEPGDGRGLEGPTLVEKIDESCPVVHHREVPARPGVVGATVRPVDPAVLGRLGIRHLWSHQATAIDAIREGRSVAIGAGTGSGKSLCYQVPVLEAAAEGDAALLVFPTKALAQDQLRALAEGAPPGLVAATYDGDTDLETRAWVRRNANVVLTNPEMLHSSVLANHRTWAPFLGHLRHVVVDELHVLRGVFGTNVAHLLRRLRRIAAHHGSDPSFVFTSASLGEPARLASALCGQPVDDIAEDGSARPARTFVLCDPHASKRAASAWRSAADVTVALLESRRTTLTFCRSRRLTEMVAARVRDQIADPDRVCSYRAGYLAEERRGIEARLWAGELDGVVATSALELGVDIGGLDATVLTGFPGTISSLRQQTGRAGRRGRAGLTVLVAGDDQLDRWFVDHPAELHERPPERAVINPRNPDVLRPHLRCAAHELPLRPSDADLWPELDEAVRQLVHDDSLWVRRPPADAPLAVWAGRHRPHDRVGLRAGDGGQVRILDTERQLIGTVDESRATAEVHPGAIYAHLGSTFEVIDLDLAARAATVRPHAGDRRTQPRWEKTLRVMETDLQKPVGRVRAALGTVEVETRVVSYTERDSDTGELLGSHPLELPARHLVTRAMWLDIPHAATSLAAGELPGALHAAEHALIGMLPLFTICDRWDVGGLSTASLTETGRPAIVVFDGYPGGAGIAELGFERADELLAQTLALVESCPCPDGCPSCVQSPKCGDGNEVLDKGASIVLLRAILTPSRAAAVGH